MHKHIGSRLDNLTTSNRSGKNPHLSDEQLLLALDGELSPRETGQVSFHLEACWSCRARSEQIGEAIADVMEYRSCVAKSQPPPTSRARATFVAQLEQLSRAVGRPSLWSRLVGTFRGVHALSQSVVPRQVLVSGTVILAIMIFMFTRFWQVPKVSANQLLENARTSEIRSLNRVAKAVVYQKVRIRMGSQDMTRTIYRDLAGKRQVDRLDLASSDGEAASKGGSPSVVPSRSNAKPVVETELQQIFKEVRFNWEDPLSPGRYGAWRDSLGLKQDEVTQVGDDLITLKTTTPEGPIAEASITVRTSDFHAVEEDLRLQDMRQVEIRELAWEIIPMEAIDPAIFAIETFPSPLIGRSTIRVPAGPTDAELAEAELQVRVAMHAERADLGEQIELDREGTDSAPNLQQSLVVRGIIGTPERKDELVAAFHGIPHVELHLKSVEEAASQQYQIKSDQLQGAANHLSDASDSLITQNGEEPGNQKQDEGTSPVPINAVGNSPALEEQLEERFPDAEKRTAFVNKAVEVAQDALAQAWALRRLRDRYSPDEVARLSLRSRQTLELLIRDDVSTLREELDSAQNLLSPLLPPDSTVALATPDLEALHSVAAEPASDWRNAVTLVFPEVEKTYNNVAALFARSDETAFNGQAGARDLRFTLIKLEAQLTELYQMVEGPFLTR